MGSDLIGTVLGGRYIPRSVLGTGANAVVYLADDRHTGGPVALKALHERLRHAADARLRLDREGRIAGSINHPNACRVTDIGYLPDQSPFLVMELLVGESLYDRLEREKQIAVDEAVDITYQVLAGLAPAHARGVVHRDLKPGNVFLVPVGTRSTLAKVLDFGGAVVETDGAAIQEIPLTAAGLVVGTPLYMTPEQAQGLRDFDARTDLYVCGTLLYVMLSGKLPFVAKDVRSLMEMIAFRPPRPIRALCPTLAPALVTVIEKAMASNRSERFAAAEEFQAALVAALAAPAFTAGAPLPPFEQVETKPISFRPADLDDAVTRRLSPADFRPAHATAPPPTPASTDPSIPDWEKTTKRQS